MMIAESQLNSPVGPWETPENENMGVVSGSDGSQLPCSIRVLAFDFPEKTRNDENAERCVPLVA